MPSSLEEAVDSIKAGQVEKGRQLLARHLAERPNDENAWLWMSRCVTDREQQRECFRRALNINPQNPHAIEGLRRLGELDHEAIAQQAVQASSVPIAKESARKGSLVYIVGGATLVLCAIALVVVVPFGRSVGLPALPSLKPETTYARSMVPIMAKIDSWLNGPVEEYNGALAGPYGYSESGTATNDEMLAFWIAMKEYPGAFTIQQREDARRGLYENLGPSLQAIATDGFDLVNDLGGIDPPPAIRVAHEQVAGCVQYRVDASTATLKLLGGGIAPPTVPEDKCSLWSDALQRIKDFVAQNR